PLLPDQEYEWLEAQTAPACLDWAKKQSQLTATKFDHLPRAKTLLAEMEALASTQDQTPDFWIWGKTLFRLRKTTANKQGRLERYERSSTGDDNMNLPPDANNWKLVVDIDELGEKEGRIFEFHSYMECNLFGTDGERLLLLLSDGGADLVEMREIDARTGTEIPDGFRTGPGRISTAWLDIDHLLICHSVYEGPKTVGDWPAQVYIWERGTDLKDAKLVFTAPSTDAITVASTLGPMNPGRAIITRSINYSTFAYSIVSLDGSVKELSGIPRGQSMTIPIKFTAQHVVVSLAEEATVCGRNVQVGTLVAYDIATDAPEDSRLSIVYEPEDDEVNLGLWGGGLAGTRSRFHFSMSKRGVERRMAAEYVPGGSDDGTGAWSIVRSIPTSTGSRSFIVSTDFYSDDIVVRETGILSPSTLWVEHEDSRHAAFDATRLVLRHLTAESADGTQIDYLLLSPKVPHNEARKAPLLMTAYGAYGISFPTTYLDEMLGGLSIVPWLRAGGSLAIPFIRGGGERGELWHEAARQKKRQKSYDDFIAVAETLCIGVFGMSNGGLLAAVMCTERPDLFGAVVSDVPLTDMLRYPTMGMGGAWIYEYGDPRDPEMAKVLRSYSPFHNVSDGVKYPPCLVTISTNDDRFAAKLKDAGAANVGGHNVSDSFKNTKLLALL
ncbi:Alpha/Beta hydrolase protein, partial [Plectosphaerella plurivora]